MTREEAINKVRQMSLPKETMEILEALAPELKESEDERIRKFLVDFFASYKIGDAETKLNGVRIDDILAYLEKQKDLDKMIVVSPEVWDKAISDAYENGKRDSEKQKEQKLNNEILEWARKNKARLNGVPIEKVLPELAESEDERIRKELIEAIKIGRSDGGISFTKEAASRCIAWLEKQKAKEKQDRMMPIYNDRDSFESALEKAWKSYNESGARTVDSCEDDYVECAHAKGFREGFLFGIEKQKEQKPVESISQLTVQGKGVYKICPRCKERMVRDDSMVYTSMPPQYRYECPKCGESECDTVMYDNPEKEEQKPADLSEMMVHKEPYIAPVPTPMVADEPKPAEWSEEDEDMLNRCISSIEEAKDNRYYYEETDGDTSYDKEIAWLKSLRPSWKPSEEQMKALHRCIYYLHGEGSGYFEPIKSLYEQLKKL